MGVVYVLRNNLNGKCYVGQTTLPIKERIYYHSKDHKGLLGRAIHKYGLDAFNLSTCVGIPDWFLDAFEIALIAKAKTVAPDGYNLHLGGRFRRVVSDETRAKLSASLKGRHSPFKGKHFSEESRAKLSAALKGREVWNKGVPMRESAKAKMIEKNTGRRMSDETKKKMSESAKAHIKTPEHIRNAAAARRGIPQHENTRRAVSAALKGKKHSEEKKARQSQIMTEWWAKRKAAAREEV